MSVDIDRKKSGRGRSKGSVINENQQSVSKNINNKHTSIPNVEKSLSPVESPELPSLHRDKESVLENNKIVLSYPTIENCMQKKSLILCINNMKKELFSMIYKKKDEASLTFPKRVNSAGMEKSSKDKENHQIIISQLQKELVAAHNNMSELSDLVSDLKLVIDSQLNRLRENPVKNHHNIFHYKKILDKKFQTIQQKLKCLDNSENNAKTFNAKGKMLRQNLKELSSYGGKRAQSPNTLDNMKQETNNGPSLIWNIPELTQKRKTQVEMWSNYFHSADKRFTMRLWIHLNEIVVSSLFCIELLIWNNCEMTDSNVFFKGHVNISIKNFVKPNCMESISRFCEIEKPKFSDIFNFNYSDLKKAGILTNDSISVECTVTE